MLKIEKDVERVLLDEITLAEKVRQIATDMSSFYGDEELVLVCILKGSVSFFSDLARNLTCPVMYDFMCVSSYGKGSVSSGSVKIIKDLSVDITDKNVVVIEDILDSGNTLSALFEMLSARKPKSLKLCCLLDKPERRVKPIYPDYVGFQIPDEFVVGYGLDYDEKYRQLPYVGILKREVYEKNE